MNKKDLIAKIAEQVELPKTKVEAVLDGVVETVTSEVVSGEKITIAKLGTFSPVERSARKGVNPKTGERIDIPAKKGVRFKASSTLKASL